MDNYARLTKEKNYYIGRIILICGKKAVYRRKNTAIKFCFILEF